MIAKWWLSNSTTSSKLLVVRESVLLFQILGFSFELKMTNSLPKPCGGLLL